LDWNPPGYRRRGRPKRTWRRTIEDEIRNTGRLWNEVKGLAGDCNAWKLFINALCSTRSKGNWCRWYATLNVLESVHRDTIMKVINKMQQYGLICFS
jgi:hypothetical protein